MADFGYSSQLDAQLTHAVSEIRSQFKPPWIAVFDADGTLWDTDIGEMFFKYQVEHCKLPELPPDPFRHYVDLKEIDHRKAYLWLAQINYGQTLAQVRKWAEESVHKNAPIPVFEPQRRLIAYLKESGFDVYIVTASIKWAVEAAAPLVGLTASDVMGIQTAVVENKIALEQFGALTWREGKVEGLLERTQGLYPHFSSGNTTGDAALLQASRHSRLAICSRTSMGELAHTEEALQKLAREQNWLTHQF